MLHFEILEERFLWLGVMDVSEEFVGLLLALWPDGALLLVGSGRRLVDTVVALQIFVFLQKG